MPLTPTQTAHLIAAMLSVNGYGTDRAAALMPAFRERGLLDPRQVCGMEREAIITAMTQAGYSRGGFLPILWYRLQQTMEAISKGALDSLPAYVAGNDQARFADALSAVHGWGPRTAATAWELWRASMNGGEAP
jgi:hypothetical protein